LGVFRLIECLFHTHLLLICLLFVAATKLIQMINLRGKQKKTTSTKTVVFCAHWIRRAETGLDGPAPSSWLAGAGAESGLGLGELAAIMAILFFDWKNGKENADTIWQQTKSFSHQQIQNQPWCELVSILGEKRVPGSMLIVNPIEN